MLSIETAAMKHDSFNESTEMYLKTICELQSGADPVAISALAARLGVSTVSATEMVHRLQQTDLLTHIPYKGVVLTVSGEQQAHQLLRTHRLWERFLVDELGLPWDTAYGYACQLEHATDTAVTEALAAYLHHPATCPHGHPIPSADGKMATSDTLTINQLVVDETAVITRVDPESPELLHYLHQLGLMPGQTITVLTIAPFNGPLTVQCGSAAHALGRDVGKHIYVNKQPSPLPA